MKVLIADKLPEPARRALEADGLLVDYAPDTTADGLEERLDDHDILVVRSTPVPAAALEKATALQLVVRAGAGFNTIDVAAASRRGIYVANCPGKNAVAVAELALGLLIAADRRLPQARAELLAGTWNKKEYARADGLFGKTLGVLGCGRVGTELIARARGLGLNVVAWSRSLTDARAAELGVRRVDTPLALARVSQLVSVHLAHAPETVGLVGAAFLSKLPAGAIVVNTSRGGIVDETAVRAAIDRRGIRYATDVFAGEPTSGQADFTHPLAQDPRVLCTPHIGASTAQAQQAVADEALRVIRGYRTTGTVANCVNLRTPPEQSWLLTVRHRDRVGVLAGVLQTIRAAAINVQEVENVIFAGATTACARLRLDSAPSAALVDAVGRLDHVIAARLVGGAAAFQGIEP